MRGTDYEAYSVDDWMKFDMTKLFKDITNVSKTQNVEEKKQQKEQQMEAEEQQPKEKSQPTEEKSQQQKQQPVEENHSEMELGDSSQPSAPLEKIVSKEEVTGSSFFELL